VIAGSFSSTSITVDGYVPQRQGESDCHTNEISADYFRTLGIPLIVGREFTAADDTAASKVAIVNESFVRHYLPGQNPIGRRLGRGDATSPRDIEIVGVVKDSQYGGMRDERRRVFYQPHRQFRRQSSLYFYVRTGVEPEGVVGAVRREVAALDSNLPIREMKTMEAQIGQNIFAERMLSVLTASFAGLATVLAAMGLYGVLAFNVARRTREIGIRMALGANAARVRGLVAGEVGAMLVIGTAAGCAAAASAGRLVRSILFGLEAWDPLVYIAAAGVLWLIALAAAYLPARRATGVDPVIALRYE
jgi:predicted permease